MFSFKDITGIAPPAAGRNRHGGVFRPCDGAGAETQLRRDNGVTTTPKMSAVLSCNL